MAKRKKKSTATKFSTGVRVKSGKRTKEPARGRAKKSVSKSARTSVNDAKTSRAARATRAGRVPKPLIESATPPGADEELVDVVTTASVLEVAKEKKPGKAEGTVVKFTKDPKSPDFVRITLYDPEEVALEAGRFDGKSSPRQLGKVEASIEVKIPSGAGGTATVNATNLTTPQIIVPVAKGKSGRDVTKTLIVVEPKE